MRMIETHKVEGVEDGITIESVNDIRSADERNLYLVKYSNWKYPNGSLHTLPFQSGSIATQGVNGITNEVLLAIVADRLEGFQLGPHPHPNNDEAIGHVKLALEALKARTRERVHRGVEGIHSN